jgi:hypothetical protein
MKTTRAIFGVLKITLRLTSCICTSSFLPLLLLLTLPAVVRAQDYIYTTNNGSITITGYKGPGGDVTIPDTITGLPVTRIGTNAFYNCFSLTGVTISDSVTNIGDGAFAGCYNLTSVTIPGSVTSIGYGAFDWCSSLTAITVDAQNASYSSLNGVLFDKSQTLLILCPRGKAGSYAIPDSITNIANSAFYGCSLTSVTIGNGVISIGYEVFCKCSGLTNVTIGSSVTSIGDNALMSAPA